MALPSDQGEFIPPPDESESNNQEGKEVEARETAEESEAIDTIVKENKQAIDSHRLAATEYEYRTARNEYTEFIQKNRDIEKNTEAQKELEAKMERVSVAKNEFL